jgi:hypothetical protein
MQCLEKNAFCVESSRKNKSIDQVLKVININSQKQSNRLGVKGDTAAIILDGVKIVQNKTENPSSPYPRALY